MSNGPDPKVVRDFARRAILSSVEDVDYMGIGEQFGDDENWPQGDSLAYDAMHDAVYDAVGEATVTVSWPAEQPQNGGAPADLWWSFTGAADTCYLEHHDAGAYRECCMRAGLAYALKVRDQLAQENGQLQDERDAALPALTAERNAAHEAAAEADRQRAEHRREAALLRARVRELEAAQDERDDDDSAAAPALRQEWGVQAEHSASAFPTRTEQVARELAAAYSRVREPGCKPTPHHAVTRFSSDWQRLPDEPAAALDARDAKEGDA